MRTIGRTNYFVAVATTLLLACCLFAEATSADAASILVNTTSDELNSDGDCSLREAVQAANTDQPVDGCAGGAGLDTITLQIGTYFLAVTTPNYHDENANVTGDLDILQPLNIVGSGAGKTVIDGAGGNRLFQVFVGGNVHLSGMTLQNGFAPALAYNGGAVQNEGTLTISDSNISDNFAGIGGGIWNHAGSLTIERTSMTGNQASDGGAILNSSGTVTITNATFNGNSFFNGGAIENQGGQVTLLNATITSNHVNPSIGFGGGLATCCTGVTTIKNTILAGNTPTECAGPLTSAGYNVIQVTGTCAISGDTTGNQYATDPELGPLASENGTLTQAPQAGSPVIDAASLDCPPPATDQTGFSRSIRQRCDIGAYEARFAAVGGAIEILVRPGSETNQHLVSLALGALPIFVAVAALSWPRRKRKIIL